MPSPTISAIAAIGQNRELGKNNDLIWRVPADLKRVKELTTGHPLIMGRKTYESIGRPLPNRTNIIISRDKTYKASGCIVVDSLDAALEAAKAIETQEIFIFGGAAIYELALPQIDTLYLTVIHDVDEEADSFFPEFAEAFEMVNESEVQEHKGLQYQWVDLKRKTPA